MEDYDVVSEAPAVFQVMNLGKHKKIEGVDIVNILLYLIIGYFILHLVDKILEWWILKRSKFPYRNYYDPDYHRDYEIKKRLFDSHH